MPTRLRLENSLDDDREFLVAAAELFLQPEAADRAEIAFDMDAEHLFELAPQVTRDQVQRLLEHRAALDGVKRRAVFQAVLQFFDQRTLARADRPHEIEHLSALLALQGSGVEVADNLRQDVLDAEELVGKEVVDFERFVLEEPLGALIAGVVDVPHSGAGNDVIQPRVGQLRQTRVVSEPIQVFKKSTPPNVFFPAVPILLDHLPELTVNLLHFRSFGVSLRPHPPEYYFL